MRRNRNGETGMIAAVLAGRKCFAFHHRHLVLVLMDTVMHYVVYSGFWAQIARFELIHKVSKLAPAAGRPGPRALRR